MDHRQTLTDIVRITMSDIAKLLPVVLAATETDVLRSTPTDGGSRPAGAHSDPTPATAMRRRRTDDRRTLDGGCREALDGVLRLRKIMTELAKTRGLCKMCVTSQIVTQPHGICVPCMTTVDRARRRAAEKHRPFDRDTYIAERAAELRTRATKATQ